MGSREKQNPFTPSQFGLENKAERLTLGDLFVNQKPITRQALIDKGYDITVLMRNSLEKHLVKLVVHAKQFDATPTRVTVFTLLGRGIAKPPSHLFSTQLKHLVLGLQF